MAFSRSFGCIIRVDRYNNSAALTTKGRDLVLKAIPIVEGIDTDIYRASYQLPIFINNTEVHMFIINIAYKKPIEVIDQFVVEHRQFLDEGYKKNYFVASGPKNPRNGGIIISQLSDRKQLEEILKQDPFCIHEVGEYEIIEFHPIKYHPDFSTFIK